MQYFDDLYIVRQPPVTRRQWQDLIRQRGDFTLPDLSANCRIYVGEVELDAAGVVIWTGHSSGQQVPVQITSRHVYIPSVDSETVVLAQTLALQLDACVVHKVHPMNVVREVE